MPYILDDLVVDRIDLVDEGANSAAFIEFFKRKEKSTPMDFSEILSKLKPEHAEVVQQYVESLNGDLEKARTDLEAANTTIAEKDNAIAEANDALAKANEELDTIKANSDVCLCKNATYEDGVCAVCGKPAKSASFDETEVLKSMPEPMRAEFLKMREQKEAAEEQVRKAREEKIEADAIAKANTLKSLPVEQDVLVNILKNCDQSVVDVLTSAAAAIDSAVLNEVGKSGQGHAELDAWDKIEAEAAKVVERDNVTKQKAIATVIKEQPELYTEYINGGKN